MITEKRHELILNELSKKDFLSLQELIDNIGCSASTIRRDGDVVNGYICIHQI